MPSRLDAGENPDTPDTTREAAFAKQDKTWPFNSTCAGRIFLVPESKQPPEATQLYVNFGFADHGCQKVPEWVDALSPVCSKEQYDETMAKLVALLKTRRPSTCCCCIGCDSGSDVKSDLTKILDESGWGGTTPPFIVSVDGTPELVPTIGTVPAYDQSGELFTQDLMYFKRKTLGKSKIPSYRTAPAWEPSGLNVVVTMPGTEAQASWPKTAQVPIQMEVSR